MCVAGIDLDFVTLSDCAHFATTIHIHIYWLSLSVHM